MVRFTWVKDEIGYENLYVGLNTDVPIAWIKPSLTKKRYGWLIEIPGLTKGWKEWQPKNELKTRIEQVIDRWISLAIMDEPARDNPGID